MLKSVKRRSVGMVTDTCYKAAKYCECGLVQLRNIQRTSGQAHQVIFKVNVTTKGKIIKLK